MANSILQYFKESSSSDYQLPNPRGRLSCSVPSAAIASANREVQSLLEKGKKRGPYQRYTPTERAKIGKFAVQYGVRAAIQRYSKDHPKINESTVRGFQTLYLDELSRKRRMGEDDAIIELQPKKQKRPLILGKD